MSSNQLLIGAAIAIGLFLLFLFLRRGFSGRASDPGDAARFAKLLAINIKLYEGSKLQHGIDQNNIYELLKKEIDDARESFLKRCTSPGAESCFNEKIVEVLAGGDPNRMGPDFPATIKE